MTSSGDGKYLDEIQEETGQTATQNGQRAKDRIALYIQPSQRGLLNNKSQSNKLMVILKALTSRASYLNLPSPSARFQQITEGRNEISRSVPSENPSPPNHSHVSFARDINWASVRKLCKEWIRNPMNMALFVWIAIVAISGAILFLVMTGMLNGVLKSKSQRNTWFEINNQILNALFTLMCLYQHPKRFYHLVLLCRWRPEDVLKLRKIYCKNGTYKPNEWMHMMVVVALLHLNCFAQYALCGLNLGYPRSKRPPIGVGLCISVSIGAPAFASVYNILSPLGRDYESGTDLESQGTITSFDENSLNPQLQRSLQKKYSFAVREGHIAVESNPAWVGGLFDFWDDISLAYLSVFCSCCVFGWNMDRLGFGNMYVHIVTFLLFCIAPFFIFNLAAININNEAVREALGLTGILLCIFGLLYGGFWRIQMRKRFNLPAYTVCCGNASVTDCFQWLCCCSCSLAQEVRTVDYYNIVENKFLVNQIGEDPGHVLSPLSREDGSALLRTSPSSPYSGKSSPTIFKTGSSLTPTRSPGRYTPDRNLPKLEESSTEGNDYMKPPTVAELHREYRAS